MEGGAGGAGIVRGTVATLDCIALVRAVATVWLSKGPTSRHGMGERNAGGGRGGRRGGGSWVLDVKAALDVNSLNLFGQLAAGVYQLLRAHFLKQKFNPQVPLQPIYPTPSAPCSLLPTSYTLLYPAP